MGQTWATIYSENAQYVFLRKTGVDHMIEPRNPRIGKLMRYRCATPAQSEKKIGKGSDPCQSALIRG